MIKCVNDHLLIYIIVSIMLVSALPSERADTTVNSVVLSQLSTTFFFAWNNSQARAGECLNCI